MARTKRVYLGDHVFRDIAMDAQPGTENPAAKLLYDALNAAGVFTTSSHDVMTDARQLLYGWGEDSGPAELDREQLRDLAVKGRDRFDALLKALGEAGADAEHTRNNESGGPDFTHAPTTADRSGREAFASSPGPRPTMDSKHGDRRRFSGHEFRKIFGCA